MLASFLNPGTAAAALMAAVAVPLIIHLLFRPRERIVEWAAMRFLPAVRKKRKRRIDHWPLFLARGFGVLLPLLAMFAVLPGFERIWQSIRPGAMELTRTNPRTHTVIILDTTLSLTANHDDESLFEAAKQQAEEIISAGNAGDGFSLILLERGATVAVAGPSNHPDLVLEEVRRAKPFHGPTELAAGLAAAQEIVQRSPAGYRQRRVVLITDRQRSSFQGLLPQVDKPPPEVWTKLSKRAELAVVDVGQDGLENLAVTGLSLMDTPALTGQPALVTLSVRNFSKSEKKDLKIDLLLGRPGSTSSPALLKTLVIDRLPSDAQINLTYLLEGSQQFREAGPHLLKAMLKREDAIAADNSRALAFEVYSSLKVLVVNGRPAADPLRRASEYLSDALVPGGRLLPGNPFEARTISFDEFQDATLSDLAGVNCLVLCDLPGFTPSQVSRMEAFLKQGGGIVLGLGSNAVANRVNYNRLIGPEGTGYLPGAILGSLTSPDGGIHFFASEAAFREAPLNAFADANARAALSLVPFRTIVQFQPDPDREVKRVLSFASAAGADGTKPEPALLEIPRHRGKVMVFASGLDRDWSDWPVLPSYLPFVRVLVQYACGNRDRWTVAAGEAIEDYFPPAAVGKTATLDKDESKAQPGEAGVVVRFAARKEAGVYEIRIDGQTPHPIAVNADISTAAATECDLSRLEPGELKPLNVPIQIVKSIDNLKVAEAEGATVMLAPKPHGPMVARGLAVVGILFLVLELILAWRSGPGRTNLKGDLIRVKHGLADRVLRAAGWLVVFVVAGALIVLVPASVTGELPAYVPQSMRERIEKQLNVPEAEAGEGTRWHFASTRLFTSQVRSDRTILSMICGALIAGAAVMYLKERTVVRPRWSLLLPFLLRSSVYLLSVLVLLPQMRLVFEREGMPDIAVVLDTSASMGTVDDEQTESRLKRALSILLRDDAAMLKAVITERRFRISVYSLAERATVTVTFEDLQDLESGAKTMENLKAEGVSTRLGDGIESILKSHRGGNLAAIVLFSDGVTTQGPDLTTVASLAARDGVPIFTIGLGDRREAVDLAIADVKAEDTVAKGDEWFAEVRIGGRGRIEEPVVVTLSEKKDDRKVLLESVTVPAMSGGNPVTVKLKTRPAETGEKTFIIEARPLSGERETANNRSERNVLVTDTKKLRVLLAEGRTRYEFRFLKTLLEREVEAAGGRSIEFHFLLTDASKDFATTDRGALRAFPTRSELFEYDVLIIGDLDPAGLPRGAATLSDVVEFVRVRGGGLLVLAGEYWSPKTYFDTPLAEVLPVVPRGEPVIIGTEEKPLTDGYRLLLTPLGRQHPMLRLSSDDAENQALWQRLPKLLWHSSGFAPRLTAELLAVHPNHTESSPLPLILQQFSGSGRVMLFGFDESWRWRLRQDEELYNRFWRQVVRMLARNRVARAEVRTEKPGPFRRDEPVKITAKFPDDAPAPSGAVRLSVERVNGNGDRELHAVDLEKTPGTRASYSTTLTKTPEGNYRLKLLEPRDLARAAMLEFSVLPPPGELDRIELNGRDLLQAAGETGGLYYTAENAGQLPDDLPKGERPPLGEPCPPLTLWNLPLVFVTILSLLGLEWILRRRVRLL